MRAQLAFFDGFAVWFDLGLADVCLQQTAAQRQHLRAMPIGQKSVMSDPHEALRQNVLQKAPQEFTAIERHHPLPVARLAAGVVGSLRSGCVGDE